MKLIINGDDFGLSHGCNLAIVDCFNHGLLSSTSMMMNMDYIEEAYEMMKENPELSVGIHLNITMGKPLCKDVNTLIKEDGTFNKQILSNTLPIDLEEVKQEFEAQWNKFVELTGKYPDHINTHHCVEQIHGVGSIIMKMANRYHVPVREFVNGEKQVSEFDIPKLCFLHDATTDEVIQYLEDHKEEKFLEVLVHPGYVDYELLNMTSLTTQRCVDANTCVCQKMRDYVKENEIEICDFTIWKLT